jgi:hypothetical protein
MFKVQLNNYCGDDEEKRAKIRLLTELVMLAMEDVELKTKHVEAERGKDMLQLRSLYDAMNKVQYYLNQLEALER